PDFLIPSRIVVVDALPLTASGKVDRKALPPLDDAPAEDDALPRNELEQQIAALWETVLQRKDLGVRTDFFAAGGQSLKAVQRVSPRADVRVSVIETTIDIDDEDALRELIARDTARRFDLERGPLWRITLFRIAPEMHLLLFNMHHLIADGRSIDVFAREISAGDELPPLAIQYKDFAAWQNTLALDDSASYWRE